MGYYTNFSISIKQGQDYLGDLQNAIEKQSDYTFDNDGTEIYSDGSIKWYEHSKDMENVSKLFPDLVLQVDGEGEESGDIWTTFWKDGKYQQAKRVVTVEDYDESKLS